MAPLGRVWTTRYRLPRVSSYSKTTAVKHPVVGPSIETLRASGGASAAVRTGFHALTVTGNTGVAVSSAPTKDPAAAKSSNDRARRGGGVKVAEPLRSQPENVDWPKKLRSRAPSRVSPKSSPVPFSVAP